MPAAAASGDQFNSPQYWDQAGELPRERDGFGQLVSPGHPLCTCAIATADATSPMGAAYYTAGGAASYTTPTTVAASHVKLPPMAGDVRAFDFDSFNTPRALQNVDGPRNNQLPPLGVPAGDADYATGVEDLATSVDPDEYSEYERIPDAEPSDGGAGGRYGEAEEEEEEMPYAKAPPAPVQPPKNAPRGAVPEAAASAEEELALANDAGAGEYGVGGDAEWTDGGASAGTGAGGDRGSYPPARSGYTPEPIDFDHDKFEDETAPAVAEYLRKYGSSAVSASQDFVGLPQETTEDMGLEHNQLDTADA